jgi:hypothetical protein
MNARIYRLSISLVVSILVSIVSLAPLAMADGGSFIGPFNTVTTLTSTVPANGDINPYGVAVVPRSVGLLVRGDVLVSNFNNSSNLQGTGTTIVQVAPNGTSSLFARINANHLPGRCPGGVGLTTALVVLRSGWVIVGSLPTTDGSSATARAGCLITLDKNGHPVETFSGSLINGPWDMTAVDGGDWAALFVTNVLNDTVARSPHTVHRGTVVRIQLDIEDNAMPVEESRTVIGSGFGERTDPASLVIGPTGVGLSADGTLYVADSLANRIAAIPDALERSTSAGTGRNVSMNGAFNDPLGLTIAPNGDILTVNGNDGNIVETTPGGHQVAIKVLDSSGNPPGAGTLFGLAVVPDHTGVYFVDDGTNTLNLLH